jgi:hypothetical protein
LSPVTHLGSHKRDTAAFDISPSLRPPPPRRFAASSVSMDHALYPVFPGAVPS